MALDHFVSQVHLRNFYAKELNSRKMFAFRKVSGEAFLCGSEDVCRIDEGSTNPFLSEPRSLEDFLKGIEPGYNTACDRLATGQFNAQDAQVVAGFAAFVIGCSPTAMRLGSASLGGLALAELLLLDRMGEIDPPPPEMGSNSLPDLLRSGKLYVTTDSKFPQALGISNIIDLAHAFTTFHWEILLNQNTERSPFLTSDFPAAIEDGQSNLINRIIPLRPDLALRIIPQIRPKGYINLKSDFRFRILRISPSEVTLVNRQIVRCAEHLIFSSVKRAWVARMVIQNSKSRMELNNTRTEKSTGFLLLHSLSIVESG